MNYELLTALSFSVMIPVIVSFFKFNEIRPIYFPFILKVWTGALNEVVSEILISNGHYNIINSNIFNLVECWLVLWFFYNLGNFYKNKTITLALGFIFTCIWIVENFIMNPFGTAFNSWFIIICSFPIVIWSINSINHLLFKEKELLKNPTFLICIAFVIFFTYRMVVEVFWLYGLMSNYVQFRVNVYHIHSFTNFLCNLIYALAILWMRKKQAFSLQF